MDRVAPKVIFHIFGLPIRDTVVSTWITMALITGTAIIVGRRRPVALEILVDFLNDAISDVMGRPARPYLPLLGALAIIIAIANIIGIVPVLNAPTRDINTPVALALVVFFSVHYFGIRSQGLMGYLKDLASPIFLLPLEIVSQISRTLSLTLRLFGNIISAELIVAVIFSLVPLFVPLPLTAFSMLTGLLQAYIFTALAAVYIGAALKARESKSSESSQSG
jgi:F-type H+-transporting ATPase subunit a